MKKLLFLLCFAYISQSVHGVYALYYKNRLVNRSEKRIERRPIESVREEVKETGASSSVKKGSVEVNSETIYKIKKFARELKSYFYKTEQIEKALMEYAANPEESIQDIATRNNLPISTLYSWKVKFGFPLRRSSTIQGYLRRKIDSIVRNKIKEFAHNQENLTYDAKNVEGALIEYLEFPNRSMNRIAESYEIQVRTFANWVSKLGLNSRRNSIYRRTRTNEQKLVNYINQGTEWKDLHKVMKKGRNSVVNTVRKLQDKGVVEINLSEDKKDRIIKDYREKLLTSKGIARKHNIKESEVYCVIHEARVRKKDLSVIPIKWKITYKKSNYMTTEQKSLVVKDYNKGLLTLKGICVKHEISQRTVQSIIYIQNGCFIKRRNGKPNEKTELVDDILTKSYQEIEKKYGYKSVYIEEMHRYVNRWMLLTDDQKRLFKQAVQKGIMPTKEELDSVKKSSVDYVNEKFKKLLFVLEATYEDIMNQYHVSRKRANGMGREFGFWKILALKGL